VAPQQPAVQQPTQAPAVIPPQPQAQQPPPQQPMQPQYVQQPYPQPTAPQSTPPKKSKTGLMIGVVVVVVILLIAVIAYLFVLPEGDKEEGEKEGENIPSTTYEAFLNDIEVDESTFSVTFETYDEGDIIDIVGEVDNVRMADVPTGIDGVDPGIWTLIFPKRPPDETLDMFDCFAYKGDISENYTIGEEGTVRVHIKEISAYGMTMEYPDESVTADTVSDYIMVPNIVLTFTETSSGNYTGGITSTSDIARLRDIRIETWDESDSYRGHESNLYYENPVIIDMDYGELVLEFRDVNNDDMLDPGDTFKLSYAGSGDEVDLYDVVAYDPTNYWDLLITRYTVP
jgi:hypothetical protein